MRVYAVQGRSIQPPAHVVIPVFRKRHQTRYVSGRDACFQMDGQVFRRSIKVFQSNP